MHGKHNLILWEMELNQPWSVEENSENAIQIPVFYQDVVFDRKRIFSNNFGLTHIFAAPFNEERFVFHFYKYPNSFSFL